MAPTSTTNKATAAPEVTPTSETEKPLVKTDEFGAVVTTMVVVAPLEEEEDDTCYIEYREPYTDSDNVQHVRIHRVPRDNWEKYARKHGF